MDKLTDQSIQHDGGRHIYNFATFALTHAHARTHTAEHLNFHHRDSAPFFCALSPSTSLLIPGESQISSRLIVNQKPLQTNRCRFSSTAQHFQLAGRSLRSSSGANRTADPASRCRLTGCGAAGRVAGRGGGVSVVVICFFFSFSGVVSLLEMLSPGCRGRCHTV